MRLKDEDIKEIARLVDEEYSAVYIANKFNYPRQSMQKIIARYKRHGLIGILHGKSKSFSIDEKLVIIKRYYAGESKSSLAVELNVNLSVVQQWISKYPSSTTYSPVSL